MMQKELFEDMYRDAWILMSYIKVHLKKLEKAWEGTPDEKKHLGILRFIYRELYDTACETGEPTQEDRKGETDYADCMNDTRTALLAIVSTVEKISDLEKNNPGVADQYEKMKRLRDRIYKAVKKIDRKIEKFNRKEEA